MKLRLVQKIRNMHERNIMQRVVHVVFIISLIPYSAWAMEDKPSILSQSLKTLQKMTSVRNNCSPLSSKQSAKKQDSSLSYEGEKIVVSLLDLSKNAPAGADDFLRTMGYSPRTCKSEIEKKISFFEGLCKRARLEEEALKKLKCKTRYPGQREAYPNLNQIASFVTMYRELKAITKEDNGRELINRCRTEIENRQQQERISSSTSRPI
jgi:hypothetical protein